MWRIGELVWVFGCLSREGLSSAVSWRIPVEEVPKFGGVSLSICDEFVTIVGKIDVFLFGSGGIEVASFENSVWFTRG